jgi:hypothetical protein
MVLTNERVAWFNGKIVRESEVMIPFRDQGVLRGDPAGIRRRVAPLPRAIYMMTAALSHGRDDFSASSSSRFSSLCWRRPLRRSGLPAVP